MNKRIQEMMETLEQRGGKLRITPEMPDELAEDFLAEILGWPISRAGARKRIIMPSRPSVPAMRFGRTKSGEH